MNCQDIARVLDEQEVDTLLAREQSAVQAHLASCRDCARDWQIHAQLSAAEIPAVPVEMRAFYAAQVTGIAEIGARRRGRLIVIGAIVAVAAAAAMLVAQLGESPKQIASVVEPTQVRFAVEPVSGEALPVASDESVGQLKQPAEQIAVVAMANPALLRIVLMPTRHDSADKAAKPAIDAYHSSLLQALRDTPDVIVDVAGRAASAEDQPANRVTVVSPRVTTLTSGERIYHSGDGQSTWSETRGFSTPRRSAVPGFAVEVMVEPAIQSRPDDNSAVYLFIDDNGIPKESFCSSHGVPINRDSGRNSGGFEGSPEFDRVRALCNSVKVLAARIVESLRPEVEPPASDTAQFISQVADASSQARDRDTAFSELLRRARRGAFVFDAAALDAITAFIGSLPPDTRRQRLIALRGVRQAGLVVPLLAFLRHDGDEQVRLEALTVLIKDYTSDSRVRTALEAVTRQDASQLVRMVAQRTIAGDAQWEPYVVATLLDKSLRTKDRLAPAQFEAGLANYPEGFEKMQSYLGSREVTNQVLDIFQGLRNQARQPGAGGSSDTRFAPPGFQGFRGGQQPQDEEMQSVASLLAVTNPSAAIDLWIRILMEDPQSYPRLISDHAFNHLTDVRRRDDPRVIKVLDDIAAGKLGTELRNQLERKLATSQQVAPR